VLQDGLVYFGEKDVRAIRLGAEFKDESVWNSEIPVEVFGSPVLHDGILFTVASKGELFAFDTGQGLTEHTSPFDALVLVLDVSITLTIGGSPVVATPGTVVRMPADIPHALDAPEQCRMLLVMLRDLSAPTAGSQSKPAG
jgi:quercetin dioxygenase-like cupin family protein